MSTNPIPFSEYLKVSELIAQASRGDFSLEVSDDYDRDVYKDADVGAYIIAVDGERREPARKLARAVRDTGNRTPLWALADSFRTADMEDFELIGEVAGYIYLG
jgi:ornithine decarboxylase